MSNQVVYLTGAPATGKSTLANSLSEDLTPLTVLSYGTLITEFLSKKHSETYSQNLIRQMSGKIITEEDVRKLDLQLIEQINQGRSVGHVIIDSHPVTKESYGFRAIPFSSTTLQDINPTMILSLSARPEIIIERIGANPEGRPQISLHEAMMHNYLQGSIAISYSSILGVPAYFLDTEKPLDEVKKQALTIIKNN